MLPSAQFWKCANSWRRNWRNRYQFESGLVFGFQTIIQRGNVGYWQIVLQKSFCVTEYKFSGAYARRSNNHLRDYVIQR